MNKNILGEKEIRKIFDNFDEDCYQPASLDLKVGKIYEVDGEEETGLYCGIKKLPNFKEISMSKKLLPDKNTIMGWYLRPGRTYSIRVDRKIKIPKGVAQVYYPRSSLIRSLIRLETGFTDPAFDGVLQFKITNDSDVDWFLGEGERFAQAVSFCVSGSGIYDGDYQEKE